MLEILIYWSKFLKIIKHKKIFPPNLYHKMFDIIKLKWISKMLVIIEPIWYGFLKNNEFTQNITSIYKKNHLT